MTAETDQQKASRFEAEAAELHQRSRTAVRGDTACLDL